MIEITPLHECTEQIKAHHGDKSLTDQMLCICIHEETKKQKKYFTDLAENVKNGRNISANRASGN